MLNNDSINEFLTPKNQQEYESTVIKDETKDKKNLRNLQKQFTCNDKLLVTRRDNSNQQTIQENKTTAATTNRKRYIEEEEEKEKVKPHKFESRIDNFELNQFTPVRKLPFDYMNVSISNQIVNVDSPTKQRNVGAYQIQHNSRLPINNKVPSSFIEKKHESVPENNVMQAGTEILLESFNLLSDAFAGILDNFLPQDSDDDGNRSIASCFGCKKKPIKKNKMITPRSRRVRATSQFRMNPDRYFKIGKEPARSKSKEFLDNNTVTQMIKFTSQKSNPISSQGGANAINPPADSR
jgi:hypothetical protein